MRNPTFALFCACAMLSACGSDKTTTPLQQTGEESLPQPDAAGGSVTGMPNPGIPSAPPPPAFDPAVEAEVADSSAVEPALPAAQPIITGERALGDPPVDTMPVMPAHPPEVIDQSQSVPPPES